MGQDLQGQGIPHQHPAVHGHVVVPEPAGPVGHPVLRHAEGIPHPVRREPHGLLREGREGRRGHGGPAVALPSPPRQQEAPGMHLRPRAEPGGLLEGPMHEGGEAHQPQGGFVPQVQEEPGRCGGVEIEGPGGIPPDEPAHALRGGAGHLLGGAPGGAHVGGLRGVVAEQEVVGGLVVAEPQGPEHRAAHVLHPGQAVPVQAELGPLAPRAGAGEGEGHRLLRDAQEPVQLHHLREEGGQTPPVPRLGLQGRLEVEPFRQMPQVGLAGSVEGVALRQGLGEEALRLRGVIEDPGVGHQGLHSGQVRELRIHHGSFPLRGRFDRPSRNGSIIAKGRLLGQGESGRGASRRYLLA